MFLPRGKAEVAQEERVGNRVMEGCGGWIQVLSFRLCFRCNAKRTAWKKHEERDEERKK